MQKTLKIGDHVRWNSEAGWVSGVVIKKLTSDTKAKGYVHHASREAGSALRLMSARASKRVQQNHEGEREIF